MSDKTTQDTINPKVSTLPTIATNNHTNRATPPAKGRLPKLYATLESRLNDAVVRQDVSVDNILADQEALAELMETAAHKSAERLADQKKALQELGLA